MIRIIESDVGKSTTSSGDNIPQLLQKLSEREECSHHVIVHGHIESSADLPAVRLALYIQPSSFKSNIFIKKYFPPVFEGLSNRTDSSLVKIFNTPIVFPDPYHISLFICFPIPSSITSHDTRIYYCDFKSADYKSLNNYLASLD
ncbi:hypothetical protein QTP88_007037 [Uroleucon formosanum]